MDFKPLKPLLIMCLLTLVYSTVAQKIVDRSDIAKTQWMGGDFPVKSNDSYSFRIGEGTGSTLFEARKIALENLVFELAKNNGVQINTVTELGVEYHKIGEKETIVDLFDQKTTFKGKPFKVALYKVDEYWEQIKINGSTEFRCWKLFEVSNNPSNYSFKDVPFSSKYGIAPVWRSALVPGWGQLYKKDKAKGLKFLIGEGLLVSGIFISEYFRKSYYNKAVETKNIDARRSYYSYSDSFTIMRNGFCIAAVIVYIYNLVDVMTAKGAKRYAYFNTNRINFYANVDKQFSCITLNINF